MEQEPFPGLKIDCSDFLNSLDIRSKCSKCEKSRKFYCYNCYLPVPEIADRVPNVKLPLKIDIIKHPSEVDGKSTAVHAGVLCPDDVTIYTYPIIPDYERDKVVIVFPCDASKTLGQLYEIWNNKSSLQDESKGQTNGMENPGKRSLAENTSEGQPALKVLKQDESCDSEQSGKALKTENSKDTGRHKECLPSVSRAHSMLQNTVCPLERVVFIDSTWNQTRSICNDERLKGLQCVEIKTEKTKFWRHQKDNPENYLSTIEAIYYFVREFHEHFMTAPYTGQYDNLLFFFRFMYKKIRNLYNGGDDLMAYKSRRDKQKQRSEEKSKT